EVTPISSVVKVVQCGRERLETSCANMVSCLAVEDGCISRGNRAVRVACRASVETLARGLRGSKQARAGFGAGGARGGCRAATTDGRNPTVAFCGIGVQQNSAPSVAAQYSRRFGIDRGYRGYCRRRPVLRSGAAGSD